MDTVRQPRADDESGFTLIEVLITVALMSIALVAILGALTVMIGTTARHRGITRAEAAARNAAEYVKSGAVTYTDPRIACGVTPPQALTGVPDVPASFTVTVEAVKGWDGQEPAGYDTVGGCATDRGVKLVTIEVAGQGASTTLSVVKATS
jgi:prepilin-type N-terminal cleavage/methylation domain-containing protein